MPFPTDAHAQASRELIDALHAERAIDNAIHELLEGAVRGFASNLDPQAMHDLALRQALAKQATDTAANRLAALVGRVLH